MINYRVGKKLVRYRQIANVVIKYGFGYLIEKAKFPLFSRLFKKRKDILPPSVRLRRLIEELGPTFIKMGQILSTRPDLVPLDFLVELEKLQDSTEPLEFEKIREVFEREMKCKIEDTFEHFEECPIASASISQVHRAVYKGQKVAVKIQKPDIEEKILLDIRILYDMAELIEKLNREAKFYRPVKIVEEFEKSVRKELDFSYEGRNIERFRRYFADFDDVIIPKVYKELTGRRVLTMEYIEGFRITDLDKIGLDRKTLADRGTKIVLTQIFNFGFFHADPHPGNILITKEGKICLLDFGIVGRLTDEEKVMIMELINGVMNSNEEKILKILELLGSVDNYQDRKKEIKREIRDFIDKYSDASLKEINLRIIFDEIFNLMRKYEISIPANFSLLAKTLLTLEGVATIIYPEYSINQYLRSYLIDFMAKKEKMKYLFKETLKGISDIYYTLHQLPEIFETSLKTIKRGYINVAFEHRGLQNFTSTMDKASNRISLSLIVAAVLISSSLVMVAGKGPKIWGHPAFGIVGFLISGIFGIYLVVSIIKKGKL